MPRGSPRANPALTAWPQPPGEPGTYLLVLHLAGPKDIAVGALGQVAFGAGYYAYVGSALGGLAARLGRYLRSERRVRWHVDYLLAQAAVVEVWYLASPERLECAWAAALATLEGWSPAARGFGASDCRCPTHLFRSAERPCLEAFRRLVGGGVARL